MIPLIVFYESSRKYCLFPVTWTKVNDIPAHEIVISRILKLCADVFFPYSGKILEWLVRRKDTRFTKDHLISEKQLRLKSED